MRFLKGYVLKSGPSTSRGSSFTPSQYAWAAKWYFGVTVTFFVTPPYIFSSEILRVNVCTIFAPPYSRMANRSSNTLESNRPIRFLLAKNVSHEGRRLKATTERALELWLSYESWCTANLADMVRFYKFIIHYQAEHGYVVDKAALQNFIEKKMNRPVSQELRRIVEERIDLAQSILDFQRRGALELNEYDQDW